MKNKHGQRARVALASPTAVLGLWLGLTGCAAEPPKPAPTVTPDQVRSHADQSFEKLKQEERTRGSDSAGPR
jgi:hypothetical protein